MKIGPRVLVWVLAVLGFLAARECVVCPAAPSEQTDLAVRQLQPSDEAVRSLWDAERSKNWLLSGGPVLLFAGLTAGCLFGGDLLRLARAGRPAAPEPSDRPRPSEEGELP